MWHTIWCEVTCHDLYVILNFVISVSRKSHRGHMDVTVISPKSHISQCDIHVCVPSMSQSYVTNTHLKRIFDLQVTYVWFEVTSSNLCVISYQDLISHHWDITYLSQIDLDFFQIAGLSRTSHSELRLVGWLFLDYLAPSATWGL